MFVMIERHVAHTVQVRHGVDALDEHPVPGAVLPRRAAGSLVPPPRPRRFRALLTAVPVAAMESDADIWPTLAVNVHMSRQRQHHPSTSTLAVNVLTSRQRLH